MADGHSLCPSSSTFKQTVRIVYHLKMLNILCANVFTVCQHSRLTCVCVWGGGAGTAIRLLQRAGEAALTGARVPPLSVAALRAMSSERMRPARYRRHLTRAMQPRCIKPGFYHGGRFSNTSGRIWSPSQLRATRHCLRQPTESDSGGRTSVIHYENMGAYRPKTIKKKKKKSRCTGLS